MFWKDVPYAQLYHFNLLNNTRKCMTRELPTLKLKFNNSYNPNNKKNKKKAKDGGIVAGGN